MDDQLTLPIKEANALLARYEDFFVKGEKVENLVEAESGEVAVATWRLGDRLVTFVFNRKAQAQDIALKIAGEPKGQKASFRAKAHDCHAHEWSDASAAR
jgi:hypothetical protein